MHLSEGRRGSGKLPSALAHSMSNEATTSGAIRCSPGTGRRSAGKLSRTSTRLTVRRWEPGTAASRCTGTSTHPEVTSSWSMQYRVKGATLAS